MEGCFIMLFLGFILFSFILHTFGVMGSIALCAVVLLFMWLDDLIK